MRHRLTPYFAGLLAIGLSQPLLAHEHDPEERLAVLTSYFAEDAIVGEPSIVDCTLSDGTETSCYAITVSGAPEDHSTGPWCPTNISQTGADAGGIWLDNGEVYEVDGPFISKLNEFYDDPIWELFNPETGEIRVTDTLEGCQAAARPDVDPEYNNYCVQCEVSFLTISTEQTYIFPVTPVFGDETYPVTDANGTGIAFSGARIDGPAPRDAILSAHTLAPFDDCGGHVNPHVGYHYHALTGCSTEVAAALADHAPIVGIALDGHMIHAQHDADGTEPTDLDECRGHSTEGLGYHYHANDPAANAILPCHKAATGCTLSGSDTTCDATTTIEIRGPGARRHD
ncbi:YHYH protein [Alphaproteobacteria bacterium KMM 3653]|uniref:YHYH protein n=1 Tax=Harenicola maris TaxID=2841044 RepID=A0AAP2CV22_9RHOB|nr:YHYH protein [Harenicola maris]